MLNNENNIAYKSLIIETQSALLLTELFKLKNYNFSVVSINIKSILQVYFKLLNEIDLDIIILCLKKFIEEFELEIFSFGSELAKELVESYKKYVVKDEAGKLSDEEQRVASRILKALTKLIRLSEKLNDKQTAKELELICLPVILFNLKNNFFGCIFAKNNLNLIYEIVNLEYPFENDMWIVYEVLLSSLILVKSNPIHFDYFQFLKNFYYSIIFYSQNSNF